MGWKDIVGKVAPTLGTALGGPFGGMAAKWLTGKVLGEEKTGEEAEASLEEFVQGASPEDMFQLKQLDKDFKLEMKRLGLKEEQLHADDRADARAMAKATTLLPQMIISTVFVIAFTVVTYNVFADNFEMTEIQKSIALYVLGILSAGLTQVLNFWFGSSSGSKEKDKLKVQGK